MCIIFGTKIAHLPVTDLFSKKKTQSFHLHLFTSFPLSLFFKFFKILEQSQSYKDGSFLGQNQILSYKKPSFFGKNWAQNGPFPLNQTFPGKLHHCLINVLYFIVSYDEGRIKSLEGISIKFKICIISLPPSYTLSLTIT